MANSTPFSLSSRLLFYLTIWICLALLATGFLISSIYKRNAEQEFVNLLNAHADNVIGAVEVSGGGTIQASPNFGDPRFSTPLSGWFWAVSLADKSTLPLVHSASLSGDALQLAEAGSPPLDANFRRSYTLQAQDVASEVLEIQLYFGDNEETLYQVVVAGNRSSLEESVEDFTNTLIMFFVLFGLGTIIVALVAIRFGLRPLRSAANELEDIREGRSSELTREYPAEIRPLATQINALIGANRSVTERARTQVGNLAHALKTPLAVVANESRNPAKSSWKTVESQAELMELQIRNYLDRARISAQRGTLMSRTDFVTTVKPLLKLFTKLNEGVDLVLAQKSQSAVIIIEEQDLQEIVGNLLENAVRFAASRVEIIGLPASKIGLPASKGAKGGTNFIFEIHDDGPGMTPEECNRAIKRGERLDETSAGSGLGLAIVKDIAVEYGGTFELTKSAQMGGLCVRIGLPMVSIS